jgi:hypothetical protein
MDPAKVAAVQDWIYPKDKKSLQMFLGFANFYRRFIGTFSDLTFPLTHLLLKDAKFDWSSKCTVAFDAFKTAFTSFPVLCHYDFEKSCTIKTDASDFAIAAVLSQEDTDGSLHPVAYYSCQLLPAEINYDGGDKELLAIVEGFKHF